MEGMMKAFELPFCLRTLERVVFFFPQVVLCADDALGSVVQAPDQTPLNVGWMVGPEVQVDVCVGGLPVYHSLQATMYLQCPYS